MLLLIHIIIAIASTGVSTVNALRPTPRLITICYAMIGATVSTGTILIVTQSSNILKSCLTGLVYIAVVSGLNVVAHYKLKQANHSEE